MFDPRAIPFHQHCRRGQLAGFYRHRLRLGAAAIGPDRIVDQRDGIDRGERIMAEAICRHVSAWTVRDRGGHLVNIEPEEVLKLEPHLVASIWRLVMGEDAPTAPDPEKN